MGAAGGRVTRDEYRQRMIAAQRPAPPWGPREAPAAQWRAWWMACDLRAVGLHVAGHGHRLTVAHGLRTADVDVGARRWVTEARAVAWHVGADSDDDTALDVALWLVEQVEPAWDVGDPVGTPEVWWGAVHPLDREKP